MLVERKGKAEVVVYKGVTFRRYPDAKDWSDRMYFVASSGCRKSGIGRLHQEIWKDSNGHIPDGHEIHHADGDPLNNDPGNLECLPRDDHSAHHASRYSEGERERRRQWFAKIRHKSANWHGSPEGIAWHREHAKMQWEGREERSYECQRCGEKFLSRVLSKSLRFCSNKCKAAARRDSGVDDESRKCERCGSGFEVNRYSKTRYCSRSCAIRSHARFQVKD